MKNNFKIAIRWWVMAYLGRIQTYHDGNNLLRDY